MITLAYLPLILLGFVIVIGVSIDFIAKRRKNECTTEELVKSAIQEDWYKPHTPNY